MKIIFIASLSHSGSTLLDLMLNAHPQVASVGELKQLGRFARFEQRKKNSNKKKKHACTCAAESLWECPFWSRVNTLTKRATGQTIGELNVEDYDNVESFQKDNVALFEAISAVAGKEYIVDSSKSRLRLKLLMDNPALDMFPVFLVRDPKGQLCSSLYKNKSNMRNMIASYVGTNRDIYSMIRDIPHAVVRYEKLVLSPEHTLGLLMESIGLRLDPDQLNWAGQERHNVGGNGMRRGTKSDLKLDDRWRQRLTLSQRLVIDLGTFVGRYPVLKFGPLLRARPEVRDQGID